jgi:hypothetical protein
LIEWVKQIPKHKPNIEEAIRSYLITRTRSWSSFGLVPWIDFFNHSDQGSFLNGEGTSIHATHAYEKGDEVNTSYGLKDTFHLLTTYGYVAKETTVPLLCPPVSKFAVAFDPNLNNGVTLSEDYPFLIKKNVNNFNQIISYFRLCAFNKHDLFFVNDIATESKRFINGENEHKAVKIGLFCLEKSKKSLENVKNNFDAISKELPESFVKEFEGKMEILKELSLKFHTHWLNLLDKTN